MLRWRSELLPASARENKSLLPFGNGRSYGDSCLNDAGILLDTRGLNRFITFDPEKGLLRCEAGVMLADILRLIVPQNWFLPVTPGTKFVTVGGAIANDVHGKNHHLAGTFGCYVREFELLRSDGQRLHCSPEENPDWFKATIGGLGLTGVILWAEFQLKPIRSVWIEMETIRFENLDEFFELSAESDSDYEYTVAWIDCMAKNKALGRGFYVRGNHTYASPTYPPASRDTLFVVPLDLPRGLLNALTLRAFNFFFYHKQLQKRAQTIRHYNPFFYPLDAIQHWNRMYGRRGFLQYQCVVPVDYGTDTIREILTRIAASGTGSFLGVLKVFGDHPPAGLMSFPRKGVTLALDFPNGGERLFALLEDLDKIVRESKGAVYPAKDARMSPESFQRYFPQWKNFASFIDPRFSSSFWRRVTGDHT